jgi:hypothetical protein
MTASCPSVRWTHAHSAAVLLATAFACHGPADHAPPAAAGSASADAAATRDARAVAVAPVREANGSDASALQPVAPAMAPAATNTDASPPRAGRCTVTLVAPQDGATVAVRDVQFEWQPVPGVGRYRVNTLRMTGEHFSREVESRLPSARLTLPPGRYAWSVDALGRDGPACGRTVIVQ